MKVITCAKGGVGCCRLIGILSVVDSKDMVGGEYEMTKLSTLPEAAQNGKQPLPEADQNGKETLLLSQEGEGQSTDPARIDIESLPVPSIEAGWPWWKIGAGCIVGGGVCLGVWCGWNLIVSHEPDSHEPDRHEPEDRHEQPPMNASALASMKVSMKVCKELFEELKNKLSSVRDAWSFYRPQECEEHGGKLVCVEDDGSPSCHFFGRPWEWSFFSVFKSVRSGQCAVQCNTKDESNSMLAQRAVENQVLALENETESTDWNSVCERRIRLANECSFHLFPSCHMKEIPMVPPIQLLPKGFDGPRKDCDCPVVSVAVSGSTGTTIVHMDINKKPFKPFTTLHGYRPDHCLISCYEIKPLVEDT